MLVEVLQTPMIADRLVRQGASLHDNSLCILCGMLASPEALLTLGLASMFSTHSMVITSGWREG